MRARASECGRERERGQKRTTEFDGGPHAILSFCEAYYISVSRAHGVSRGQNRFLCSSQFTGAVRCTPAFFIRLSALEFGVGNSAWAIHVPAQRPKIHGLDMNPSRPLIKISYGLLAANYFILGHRDRVLSVFRFRVLGSLGNKMVAMETVLVFLCRYVF